MARNQIIYNVQDIFMGPSPASGYHFINYSGGLNNNHEDLPYVTYEAFQYKSPNPAIVHAYIPKDKNENTFPRNHNLLKRLDRIQEFNYSISSERTNINQIGKAATIDRIHLTKPEINLNFSYLVASLKNEARMGFNVNYPRLDYPCTGDKYFFRTDKNNPLFLFSGFLNRDGTKPDPIKSSRGEGIDVKAPCFAMIQPTPSPNPNVYSNYIPYYIGKNLNPLITIAGKDVVDAAAGFYHSFVVNQYGVLTGWGDNQEGQLVNYTGENNSFGEFTGIWENTTVGKLSGIKKISTNYLHNLVILSNDTISGWGGNEEGQVAGETGFNDNNFLFTGIWSNSKVSSLTGVNNISAGAYHSLALLNNGKVTGWGNNEYNQAFGGNNLTGCQSISAGGHHSLSILNISSGKVTGWGDNEYGQALSGNNLTGVKQVSAGYLHSFALLHNGRVTGWGWNDDGQVAGIKNKNNSTGIFTGKWSDTPVGKLTGVKSIHAGWFHTLALLENNKITGWGLNNVGQINENISYNDSQGMFTGNWNSTAVGVFENVLFLDTSYQNTIAFKQYPITSNPWNKKEITGWGEDDINYDIINDELIVDPADFNEYGCLSTDPFWPLNTRDKRNIFVAIAENEIDHNQKLKEDFANIDNQDYIDHSVDPRATGTRTIGFGNCYLSSYNQKASIGNFIEANVSYIAENMLFQMSGSGALTPYVDPKKYITNTGIKFNIPNELGSRNNISALSPGDLTLNINSSGYGLEMNDIRIQGYEFSFDFNRERMEAIGYKLPLDREINLPLIISIGINLVPGEQAYSDFSELIRKDESYDILINCKSTCNYDPNFIFEEQTQSSNFEKRFLNVYGCQFFNCKFEGISSDNSIDSRKSVRFNFSTEIDPEDYTKGMQMSGLLGIEKIEDFLLTESGQYFLQEDGNLLVSNLSVLY